MNKPEISRGENVRDSPEHLSRPLINNSGFPVNILQKREAERIFQPTHSLAHSLNHSCNHSDFTPSGSSLPPSLLWPAVAARESARAFTLSRCMLWVVRMVHEPSGGLQMTRLKWRSTRLMWQGVGDLGVAYWGRVCGLFRACAVRFPA